ncbi:MAG: M12 family metallo-peptidase [Bacteroidia bacterium]
MKTKLLITLIFTVIASGIAFKASAQNSEQSPVNAKSNSLFKLYEGATNIDVSNDISNAVFLELDYDELARIYQLRAETLELTVPVSVSTSITFNMHSTKILSDNFKVRTSSNDVIKYIPGIYYQGTVAGGRARDFAGISIFDNSIMSVFSINHETYVLGLWEHGSNPGKNIYILYKDMDVKFARDFKCSAESLPETSHGVVKSGNNGGNQTQSNNCIKIYFECDYQMFVDKGSVNGVTNYVSGLFSVVQLLFNNEQINTEISEIYVWTTTDPYVSNATSSDYLNDFQATRTSFNGNLAHLLTTRNLGIGGVAYLDVICTPSNAYGFSEIETTYQAYPNYSNTILIVTHELGHNFGSKHTHWCGWPGGPIDNCVPVDDGPCTAGPSVSANGGTIMSYCHLNVGTSLSNGFGTLPGNKIRAQYAAATCLTACDSPPDAQFTSTLATNCNVPQTITFTDASTFGTNAWQWDVDNDGTVDYTTQNPSHTYTVAGSYTVKLIASNTNGSDTIIKTNYVSVGTVPAGASIAITTGTNSFCQGTSVTFTATPTNGGTSPAYQWKVNGNPVSGETNPTFTSNTLTGNPVVTCEVTSNATCASPATATSSGITLTITPTVTPEISISLNGGTSTICAGETVSFTSSIFGGGSGPTYEWKVGATSVGTGNAFTSSSLSNADIVTCTLTSNATCANPATITSNSITVTVNQVVTPTATISLSSGTLPTCPGTAVTFAAASTNGGSNPIYQWQKNGVNVFTGTSFTPVNPANGDVITCIVTSDAQCLSTTTATSNSITINLISPVVPTVSMAITTGTNPSCTGASSTYTATPVNGGTNPSYQWYLNGFPITGAQSSTYSPDSVTSGDVLSCEITSDGTCPQTVTSNEVTLQITPVSAITFLSDIDVCAGNIPTTVVNSNPPGASFTWTNSNTAIGLGASGTGNVPSFTASNTGASPITATVTVTPSIDNCPGTPDSYTITVNPTPEITQSGAMLTSSSGSGYQWYVDGSPVMGATSQTHTAMQNGEYMVILDGTDCPSESVTVTTAAVDEAGNDLLFTVYPNPNAGEFVISFVAENHDTYTLKVVNAIGEIVYMTQQALNGQFRQQVDLNTVSKGVYLVTLSSSGAEINKKVVIY